MFEVIKSSNLSIMFSFRYFYYNKNVYRVLLFKSKAGTVDCSGFAYIRLMNYYFFTEEGV